MELVETSPSGDGARRPHGATQPRREEIKAELRKSKGKRILQLGVAAAGARYLVDVLGSRGGRSPGGVAN
jgi:hypothetical protein